MTEFRSMTEQDISSCISIYNDAFELQPMRRENNNGITDYFRAYIGIEGRYSYVLTDNDAVLGFILATGMPSIDKFGSVYVDCVAIDPALHNKGLGTEMMSRFLEAIGVKHTFLHTTKDSSAYKVYKKLGFIEKPDYCYMYHIPGLSDSVIDKLQQVVDELNDIKDNTDEKLLQLKEMISKLR